MTLAEWGRGLKYGELHPLLRRFGVGPATYYRVTRRGHRLADRAVAARISAMTGGQVPISELVVERRRGWPGGPPGAPELPPGFGGAR